MANMAKKTDPKITHLEKSLNAEHEARLRLAAEFANFQRRTEEEKKQIVDRAKGELLEELFPIMDNLERSSTHAPAIDLNEVSSLSEDDFKKMANYFSGLRLIEKQLEQVLSQAGFRKIPTVGSEFDPNLHEAISHESSAEVPNGAIIAEVESGWLLDDHVLKPAKVRVSKG